jgi:hypothetical protein
MKNKFYSIILLLFAGLLLVRCSKKDDFVSDQPSEYMNMAVGKYVTYRLDSLYYVNFGQKDTVVKYQAKDVVDAAVTDNLGRPSWRIVRYLNDTAAKGVWAPDITYLVTISTNTLEVVENNLRFLKLKAPVLNDYTWKGNSYINTNPPANPNVDPDYTYFDNWDYTYANVGESFTSSITPVENTITINQRDEILGTPNNIDAYSERNLSQEVYGKGIGLIYKSFLHWVFQPRTTTYPTGYYDGYGITLRMIDHN